MSCSENFDREKVKSVILYLVYKYPSITTTRLQKLYYLAELRSIEKLGTRLSDANYCSYLYGPYSPDVSLVADGLIDKEIKIDQFEVEHHPGRAYKPNMERVIVNISKPEIEVLDEILSEYKWKKNESILKEVKRSEPYTSTKFLQDIDFGKYKEECDFLFRNSKIKRKIEENKKAHSSTYNSVEDLIKSLG